MPKAFTSPVSVAVGDDITATLLNSYKTGLDNTAARSGGRCTTTQAQAIGGGALTTLTNNAAAVWTATEDTGGYATGVSGTATPIQIPAGQGGDYIVGGLLIVSLISTGRLFFQPRVNGASTTQRMGLPLDTQAAGAVLMNLNAGDTLGMEAFTSTAANLSIGCQIYCFRTGL